MVAAAILAAARLRLGRKPLDVDDSRPLDENSAAYAGRHFSRAYLRHLVKSGEILGMMALTAINLAYYQSLMARARNRCSVRASSPPARPAAPG